MMWSPRPRLALATAAVVATVLVLTGCTTAQQAGSAATIGDTRISESQLGSQVQEVLVAQGQSPTASNDALVSQTLSRLVTAELVDRLAASKGVVVTQGQIDEQLASYEAQAGDRKAVESQFVDSGVAPSQIESVVRLNLQAQALGILLDPKGSAEEQGQAVFDAVVALGKEVGTDVSPRYGTWDPESLQLGDTPNDLSSPPAES
jgi:hypothetical protein